MGVEFPAICSGELFKDLWEPLSLNVSLTGAFIIAKKQGVMQSLKAQIGTSHWAIHVLEVSWYSCFDKQN